VSIEQPVELLQAQSVLGCEGTVEYRKDNHEEKSRELQFYKWLIMARTKCHSLRKSKRCNIFIKGGVMGQFKNCFHWIPTRRTTLKKKKRQVLMRLRRK
jgi:hypothetical protein